MAIEDLSTYTEVDVAASRVAVSGTTATVTDIDQDESVAVYKDFTAGHFDALDIDFEFKFVGASHGTLSALAAGICLTTNLETTPGGVANTDPWLRLQVTAGPVYQLALIRGAVLAADTSVGLSADTLYYCTISRAAGNNTITCTIYSDSGRTTTVDTLSVAGYSTATWRYLYAMMGYNNGTTARAMDFVIQNINLSGATAYTISLAAAMTPTATLTKQTNKALAGSMTSTATVIKLIGKRLAASMTPTAAVTFGKIYSRLFSASMTPIAGLVKQINKNFAASMTSLGSLVTALLDYINLTGKSYDVGLSGSTLDFSLTGKKYDVGLSGQTYDFSLTGKSYDTNLTGQSDE